MFMVVGNRITKIQSDTILSRSKNNQLPVAMILDQISKVIDSKVSSNILRINI